jgi:hypothetical protein
MSPYLPPLPQIRFSRPRNFLLLVCGTLLFNFGGCAGINGNPNETYAIPQATFNEGGPSMADSVAVPYQ